MRDVLEQADEVHLLLEVAASARAGLLAHDADDRLMDRLRRSAGPGNVSGFRLYVVGSI